MAESKVSTWVVIVGAALLAALVYGLSTSNDAEVDGAVDAGAEDSREVVKDAPAVATASPVRRSNQSTPKQIRMNTEVDAARNDVIESMKKMADEAAKAMESQKKGVEKSMGGMNDMTGD